MLVLIDASGVAGALGRMMTWINAANFRVFTDQAPLAEEASYSPGTYLMPRALRGHSPIPAGEDLRLLSQYSGIPIARMATPINAPAPV